MLARLARTCYHRRRLVVLTWIAVLVGLFALSGAAGGTFKTEFSLPGSESQEAIDLMESSGFATRAGASGSVVFKADEGVDSPEVRSAMEDLFAEINTQVDDVQVVSPYGPDGERQISPDGTIAYAELNFADLTQSEYEDRGDEIEALHDEVSVMGLEVELGGDVFAEMTEPGSEGIALLAAVVILLLAFGSVLAMGLPIGTALFGIGAGIAIVQLMANFMDIPEFTTATVAMIAIGVGIDYALLIVTRHREGLDRGLDPEASVVVAISTAGRATLFAGTTVVISLLGMIFMGLSGIDTMGVAISAGVVMVMAASVTLLPALMGFVGRNIDRLRVPGLGRGRTGSESRWYGFSHAIQRRPWPFAIGALAVLLVLLAPVFGMRLGFPDAGNRPETDTTRQAYDLLSEGFGPGFNGGLLLAAEVPDQASVGALQALQGTLEDDAGVALVTPPQLNEAGDAAIMQVIPTTSPQEEATNQLVHHLRDDLVPEAEAGTEADIMVGGFTAGAIDFADYTATRMPIFFAAVLGLSFLLLAVVFRSVLVPLKAVLMNLLSIGAAYGVIVAIFQWGWAKDLVGIGAGGPIDAWAPMMLFAVVFGLSMDYEVFLLSRIREEYDRSGDNASAVADGLATTARVITAAAAIMVVVFGSFVLGSDRALKLMGVGLASAIFVDATIVRLILVPATMELLGDRNWWLPRWMNRILPKVRVEGPPSPPPTTVPAPPAGDPVGAGSGPGGSSGAWGAR